MAGLDSIITVLSGRDARAGEAMKVRGRAVGMESPASLRPASVFKRCSLNGNMFTLSNLEGRVRVIYFPRLPTCTQRAGQVVAKLMTPRERSDSVVENN